MINELINYSSKGLIKNVPAELFTYLKNRIANKFVTNLVNLLALKVLHNDIFELTYLSLWYSPNDTSLNYVNNTLVFVRTDPSYNHFKTLKNTAIRAVELSPIAERIDKRNFSKLVLNYNSDQVYFYISDQLIYMSETNTLILNLSNDIPDDDVMMDILNMFINKTNIIQTHNFDSKHFEKTFLINELIKKFSSNNREELSKIVKKMYELMKNKVFDLNNELRNRKEEYKKTLEYLNNLRYTIEHTDEDHQTNRLVELFEMNSVKERIESISFINSPSPSRTLRLKLKPAPIQYINYTRLERAITNLKMSEERRNFIKLNIDNFKSGKFAFFNPSIHVTIELDTLKHRFEYVSDTHNIYVNHHTTYGSQGCLGTFDLDFTEARTNADLKKIILLLLQYLSSTTIGDTAGDYNIENMMIGEVETKKLIFLKKPVTKNITIEEFENANFKLS